MALVGGAVFLAASLASAAAPELWSLNAFRAVQGLGAALLLLGALPLTRRLAATPERGSALWTGAGVLGAALGPALGGVLTELLGWRSIFLVQAPFAALAVVVAVVLGRSVTSRRRRRRRRAGPGGARGRRAAGAALALASAALVGLLFLAVVMLSTSGGFAAPRRRGGDDDPAGDAAAGSRSCPPAPGRRAGAALVSAGAILLPAGSPAWRSTCPQPGLGRRRTRDRGLRLRPARSSVARAALAEHGSPVSSGDVAGYAMQARRRAGRATPLLTADLIAAGTRPSCAGSCLLDAPAPAGDNCGSRSTSPPCSPRRRARSADFGAALAEPGARSPASGVSSMRP
jgi:MFS family permease